MRLLLLLALAATPMVADEIDDYVRAELAKRRSPGLAIAVARDGRIVKQQTYGVANVELNVPVTLDTVFLLASMTKVFTSAAVLALVNDGKVGLDDPISKLVPGLPASWKAVTVRHCLS